MRKRNRAMFEEPTVEVVDTRVVANGVIVPKNRCAEHAYTPVLNDAPWFTVLLVHPDPAKPTDIKATRLFHTSDYKQACREATKFASQHPCDKFVPVSRMGWPPSAAWSSEHKHMAVYVTVDEERSTEPYVKATQATLLRRCRGLHQIVFRLGSNGHMVGEPSAVSDEHKFRLI
jgi:hypothetical protein